MRPRLLDLFCGAGGAAMGYHRAGFEVVGVDLLPQPHYPFAFAQADAFTVMRGGWWRWGQFDAIHASPPCQLWTAAQVARKQEDLHFDLITPMRPLLDATGLPYVIENVRGAPLHDPIRVCMAQHLRHDGFELRRHRYFETNWPCLPLGCGCGELPAAPVFGHSAGRDWRNRFGRDFDAADKEAIMGIDWMNRDEVAEAIPPAFAEFVGTQLIEHLAAVAA